MIQRTDFKVIDHFTFEEVCLVCDPYTTSLDLIITLDKLMHDLGSDYRGITCILHDINLLKYGRDSYHYSGAAVCCHFTKKIHRNIILQKALTVGFTGIGMYPWGWHFDVRPGEVKLWRRPKNHYLPMVR